MSGKVKMEVPYFQVPNDIFDLDMKEYEKLTYIYLCRCGNHGGRAFPSYQTIADKCGVSRSSAMRAVKKLAQMGLIKKQTRRKNSKDNDTNVYVILPPGSISQTPPSVTETPPPSVTEELPSVRETPRKRTTYKEIDIDKEPLIKKESDPSFLLNSFIGIWNRNLQIKTGKEPEEIPEPLKEIIQEKIEQGISETTWFAAVKKYFELKGKRQSCSLENFLDTFDKYADSA